ncbi:unnamed protein product, partial [Callosobruchus maculatus]
MEHGWRLETVEGGGSCGGGVCLWCWSCRISVEISKKLSDVGAPYPGCREAIRESYKRRGLAEDCIPVLLASLSDNTIKQYNASLQKWWTFCSKDNLDVFNSDSKLVMFLKHNLKSTEAVVHVFVCVFIEIRDEVSIELAEEYWKKISRVFLKHNLKSTEAVVHVFVCVFIEIRDEVSIELAEEYWKKISRVTLKIFLNQRALIYLMKIDKIM